MLVEIRAAGCGDLKPAFLITQLCRGRYRLAVEGRLRDRGTSEPQYQISNAEQSYDRVVREHELTEDLD
jgi:hypothetical protein